MEKVPARAFLPDIDPDQPAPTNDPLQESSTKAWNELIASLIESWPLDRWCDVGVLIGCSGGADSVALVRLLHSILQTSRGTTDNNAAGFLVVGHFDHRLRGDESSADAASVVQLASQLGLQYRVGSGETAQKDEAYLRDQRYAFLQQTAASTGCRYIALAHSLDDNVETVLHHLMRGTGPAGLAGIAPARDAGAQPPANDFVLTRPLLGTRRQLIRDALREIGQPWRDDSSNQNTDYQRNWIRGELLPLMQSRFPEVVPAIGRAIESQRDWRLVIDSAAKEWINTYVTTQPFSIRRSSNHNPSITIAALQMLWQQNGWSRTAMTQRHWRQLAETLSSDTPNRYTLPGKIEVVANSEFIVVTK